MKDSMILIIAFAIIIGVGVIGINTIQNLDDNARQTKNATLLKEVTRLCEQSYFEGQKDYMNGDIRIQKDGTNYSWTKSPWDEGMIPIFNP